MKLVDANVLVYTVNEDAEHHRAAKAWLDGSLSGAAPVGFAWNALVGFLRITTSRRILPSPLRLPAAVDYVNRWLDQPPAHVLLPTARHLSILGELLNAAGANGNLVNDAHLAALAIEHKAQVVTFDRDFGRFPGVRWELPE